MMEEPDSRRPGIRLFIRKSSALVFCVYLTLAWSLAGCMEEDLPPELPFLEVAEDIQVEMFRVEFLVTDSAVLVARMRAGRVAERVPGEGREPYQEMTDGVLVDLFDPYGRPNGSIQSDSAILYERTKEIALYGQVILMSNKQERMETDSIRWSQQSDSLKTQAPVRIFTAAQEILAREGMKAKADLSSYTLYGTSGEVAIDEP